VIHTVGPVWRGGASGEPETLARCYRSSLGLATDAGCRTVAFPAISTGVYGYPPAAAARIAVAEVAAWLAGHPLPERVVLCAFSGEAAVIIEAALDAELRSRREPASGDGAGGGPERPA
jgi:O-acetyl-ADP-ribose deacetylase (regulator of RNase III)